MWVGALLAPGTQPVNKTKFAALMELTLNGGWGAINRWW